MDFSSTTEGGSSGGTAGAPQVTPMTSSTVLDWAFPVEVDRSRDALLTDFGRETLKSRAND